MRIPNTLIATWNLCALFFLASTAFTQWPGLHHDSALYTTPIIKSAALGIWEFDGFMSALVEHESSIFNFHGQLYQFIFSKLLRISDYESLFRWTAALNVLTYLVYLVLGWKIFQPRFPRAGGWITSGVAAVTALACVYLQGRPEHMLPLLMVVPFLMREWHVTAAFARQAAYVMLGLTVTLSPIPGVFALLGMTAWISLRHRNKWIREIILCGTLSLSAALAILLMASPVNPWQWALHTVADGKSALGFFDNINIPTNMGVFSNSSLLDLPLWNAFTLGAFAVLALSLLRNLLWWLALLYVMVFLFVLVPKTLIYSYFGFMPIIMLALLGREANLLRLPAILQQFPVVLVSSFSFFAAAGLFRAMILAVLFSTGGVSFEQTRTTVNQLESMLGNHEKIGYIWLARPSFVIFSKPEKFLIAITLNVLEEGRKDPLLGPYEEKFDSKIRYVLLPQLGHVAEPPPTLNDGMFVLETNGWTMRRARFLGLKLGGAMPGYQFALYSRKGGYSRAVPPE